MMNKVDPSLCVYKMLDERSHMFMMVEGTREAVMALAQYIEQLQIAQKWYGAGQIRLLLDARSAVGLPIRYLFEVLSDYNRAYPDLEPPGLKLALIRNPEAIILDIYHMMAELFEPPLTMQFFLDEDRAKRWLLESD